LTRVESPVPHPEVAPQPCVGLLETASIATGYKTADAVLWQSAAELLFCEPVSSGKFVLLFTGEVEEVRSSLSRGREVAGDDLREQILIPNLEPSLLEALRGRFPGVRPDAIGVIETTTVGATILAGDVALKTADVTPAEVRLGNQLGGKAFIIVTGAIGDVRAAVTAGASVAEERGSLVRDIVIAGPHPSLIRRLKAPGR
jgi:microcompartment protein CcmL/EutN